MENVALNQEVKKEFVYKAQLMVDQKHALLKFKGDNHDIENHLANLSFREGSRLFIEVMKAINPKAFIPNPDGPVGPVPDPFGILSGHKHIPWQILNPAVQGRIRCMECEPMVYNMTTHELTWSGVCYEVPCE
jgi:hypothetical protein